MEHRGSVAEEEVYHWHDDHDLRECQWMSRAARVRTAQFLIGEANSNTDACLELVDRHAEGLERVENGDPFYSDDEEEEEDDEDDEDEDDE